MEEKRVGSGRFILTQPISEAEAGVRSLLETVRATLLQRDCVVYWRYPLFLTAGNNRKAPDLLILDREWGLVVLEVVNSTPEQAVDMDKASIAAQEMAFRYLGALLEYCDRHPLLHQAIAGRAIAISLNVLSKTALLEEINQAAPLISAPPLTDEQWKLLLMVMGGAPTVQKNAKSTSKSSSAPQSRSEVVEAVRSQLYAWDEQQEVLGKQIPPGVQRIRGIAGSGKTVLLCQKAAHMHLAHPDWDIALVFFTRSLYDQIQDWCDRWLRHFSNGEVTYATARHKLKILHTWGGQKPGFYQSIAEAHGIKPLRASDTPFKKPSEGLAYACSRLMQQVKATSSDHTAIQPLFDAVLIDEGQDLVVEDSHKFEEAGELRQPFYWLAYQACRPASSQHPEQRRLIWAYDEAQSLDSLKIPTAKELFGDRLSHLVKGLHPGSVHKSVVLRCCYRTPAPILVTAHAMGMGLLRPAGMITGLTTKADWEAIGYEVIEGSFNSPSQPITLQRPHKTAPNPAPVLLREPSVAFESYPSREAELEHLVARLRSDRQQGLQPSRDLMVIALGLGREAIALESQILRTLMQAGLDTYVASAQQLNQIPKFPHQNPDQFWHPDGITLSRVNRAKGNEAYSVHIVGLDQIAKDESNPALRNQLFIAMTRSKGWVSLSGIGEYALYGELQGAIAQANATDIKLTFQFHISTH